MKRNIYLGLIIAGMVVLSSCEDFWTDCVEGNHRPVEQERVIQSFDRLYATGAFDVFVERADSVSFRIIGEENLLNHITSDVFNNKLNLEVEDHICLRNNIPIRVFITTPSLRQVTFTGSGLIECDTIEVSSFEAENTGSGDIEVDYLDTERLEAKILGSGDIELEGRADQSRLEILGSGNIYTLDLLQASCDARIMGSGNIYTYVTNELDARITGSGNIYYKGNPDISSRITGSGQVIRYR